MRIERVRPAVLQVTMHTMELASLISAARWALDGAQGALPREAAEQLRQVLASYDEQVAKLDARA